MEKLTDISLGKVRVEESFGFLTHIVNGTSKLPVGEDDEAAEGANPVLTAAVKQLKAAYAAFDDALKDKAALDNTAAVTGLDEGRDISWRNSNAYVKAMCGHPDADVAEKAEEARKEFLKYGDPTRLPLTQESGVLTNLLQDLKKLDASIRTALALDRWIEDLEEKATAFVTAYEARLAEAGDRRPRVGIIKQKRQEAENAYRAFVDTLNALVTLNGDEHYKEFISYANSLIDSQKRLLKARTGKGSSGKNPSTPGNEDDRPVIPDEDQEPDSPDVPDEGEGGEDGEDDRPVIPDEGGEKPEPGKDENGDDLPPIE